MSSFIEDLYFGNIEPQSHERKERHNIKKEYESLEALEKTLNERLDGEDRELFMRFCNEYDDFISSCELDSFVVGFRLGARFMMDVFGLG